VILKIFAELVKLYPEMRRRTPRPTTQRPRAVEPIQEARSRRT
jgi:hypothetical protein